MYYTVLLYEQVVNALLRLIEDSDLLPGEPIPSERELAELYGVSRTTIKKAITVLVENGKLYKVHGSGTFVANPTKNFYFFTNQKGDTKVTERSSFSARAKSMGFTTKSKVHFRGFLEPSNYIKCITNHQNEKLFCLIRTRFTNEKPAVLEYAYSDLKYDKVLEELDFSSVSLYDYMHKNGYYIAYFDHQISLISASKQVAKALHLKENDSVFLVEYFAYNNEDEFVEYTKSYINPSQIKLNIFEKRQ